MTDEQKHWLKETLKTIGNHCQIAQMLIDLDKQDLLPTVLEEIYEDAQGVIDEHCVKRYTVEMRINDSLPSADYRYW